MADPKNILNKAKALLGNTSSNGATPAKALPAGDVNALAQSLLERKGSLDVYVAFDTTGSMSPYLDIVRENLDTVTGALLDGNSDLRLSMNGIGDHGDGENWIQLYALSINPVEVRGALEGIVMTSGGDEPEAYECLAQSFAARLPRESAGRKRAVVLIGDSYPHGMQDEPCEKGVDYQRAFAAMKVLSDGFYFVGCQPQMYALQRKLIDSTRKDREQFIPLGDMVEVLPALLVALARKTESEKSFADYMKQLQGEHPEQAGKIRGLLGAGR